MDLGRSGDPEGGWLRHAQELATSRIGLVRDQRGHVTSAGLLSVSLALTLSLVVVVLLRVRQGPQG